MVPLWRAADSLHLADGRLECGIGRPAGGLTRAPRDLPAEVRGSTRAKVAGAAGVCRSSWNCSRFMVHSVGILLAGPRWKIVVAAAGVVVAAVLAAAAARFASADAGGGAGALTLDDAWFVSLARAESLIARAGARAGAGAGAEAGARSDIDSLDRVAVAQQIRLGVSVLGSLVHASVSADTLLDRPIAARPSGPPRRGWESRLLRVTGLVSAAASLLHLPASLGNAGPGSQRTLAWIGGSAAVIGQVVGRSKSRLPSSPAPGPIDRIRMVGLEADVREAIQETEHAAESLWEEVQGMAMDSCSTDDPIVTLARRYVNALGAASVTLDARLARSAAAARMCAEDPGFDPQDRERLRALASHMDAVGALWRERQWLFERSRRNALDCLALLDRP